MRDVICLWDTIGGRGMKIKCRSVVILRCIWVAPQKSVSLVVSSNCHGTRFFVPSGQPYFYNIHTFHCVHSELYPLGLSEKQGEIESWRKLALISIATQTKKCVMTNLTIPWMKRWVNPPQIFFRYNSVGVICFGGRRGKRVSVVEESWILGAERWRNKTLAQSVRPNGVWSGAP